MGKVRQTGRRLIWPKFDQGASAGGKDAIGYLPVLCRSAARGQAQRLSEGRCYDPKKRGFLGNHLSEPAAFAVAT